MNTNREQVIIRTSIIGILANVFLAAFKAVVGILSSSIAVVLDAVNNLSDALSSVITIVGTKLAGKQPDKKHPLGYGRIEYLSAMVVAALVLYAGITSLVESVKKIIHPETPDYSITALIIIASAVIVKLILGSYVKKTGERVNSSSLVASGSDARFDAILSASVFLCAVIFLLTGLSLEAYVGVIIALFIIKAGVEMLSDTVNDLLGRRTDRDFLHEIQATLCENPHVHGAYDMILHSYGPDRYIGSVHVEVDDTMTADAIDEMERELTTAVFRKHNVILGGISIYAVHTGDGEAAQLRNSVIRMIAAHEGVLQVHGFRADLDKKTIQADVILDFMLDDRKERFAAILEEVQKAYPDYTVHLTMDLDV